MKIVLIIFLSINYAFGIQTKFKKLSCKDRGVRSFKSFDNTQLKYRYIKGKTRSNVDYIQLQGGPGSKVIETGIYIKGFSPRRSFMMDLRGTHCNSKSNDVLKAMDISTKALALDWLTLAKKENIKKVLIHGLSFGTVLSVQVADLFEKNGIDVIGIIQDGTVGEYKEYSQFAKFYYSVWVQHVSEYLSADYKDEIKKQNPYGFTRDEFAKLAEYSARNGYIQWKKFENPYPLTKFIAELKSLPERKAGLVVSWLKGLISKKEKREKSYVYRKLSCVEINPSGLEYNLILSDKGYLVSHPKDVGFCDRTFQEKRPFRPENFSFDAPILFVEGSLDPNTPIFGALTQAKAFQNVKRTFLVGHGGGHGSFLNYFKTCQLDIIKTMYAGKSVTERTLKKCAKYDLLISAPGDDSLTQNEFFKNVMIWYDSLN